MPNPWILRCKGNSHRRLQLYCFAHAGASGAAFLSWQTAFDPSIEICAVQLPGRGARLAETPRVSISGLLDDLAALIARQGDLPFALLGHSLGGLLAFELARRCQWQGLPTPSLLFVSGCASPQRRRPPQALHHLDDAGFIDALRVYNGTPRELLRNAEMMELALPALRADFQIAADYRYCPGPPLTVPIQVLAGRQDDRMTSTEAEGWQSETTQRCQVHWFDGDHFFIDSNRGAVQERVAAELAELICA